MFAQLVWFAWPIALAQVGEADPPIVISTRMAGEYNYTWTVENHGSEPISEFEITAKNANLAVVPDGWDADADRRRLHVWSTSPKTDLQPGQTMEINLTLMYGEITNPVKTAATLRTRAGRTITVPDVQAPGLGKKLGPLPVLGVFGGGLLLMILISRRRARRQALAVEDAGAADQPTDE